MAERNTRLVYSTDGERVVSEKAPRPVRDDRASRRRDNASSTPPADGIVRVSRETKGRRGKTVTIITGLAEGEREIGALLKTLKQHCGAGGTRDGQVIEIQGDHRDRVQGRLEMLGYQVKLAGG